MIALLVRVFQGHRRRHVTVLLSAAVACLLAGAALFDVTQQVGFGQGFYWAITTATTVGYGDVIPHNGAGEIIATAVMLTTIPLLAAVFALLTADVTARGIRADMLTELVESERHSLKEVEADETTIGRPLSAIRDERAGLVLGLVHQGTFRLGIGEDTVIANGDALLLAEPAPARA